MRQDSKVQGGRAKFGVAASITGARPERRSLGEWIHGEMVWFDKFLKRWLVRIMVLGTHLAIAITAFYFAVWGMARGKVYDNIADIPSRECGLVLGTVPKTDGRSNQFFKARMLAAANLYKEQKVRYLIVSGDNSRNGYDEPSEMKAALIALGVPATKIYCDYAGFRTLDSVIRARKVFGQKEFTIISQKYHNERAIYIAHRNGLSECVAFNATDATGAIMWKQYARETIARVMAVLDVEFLKTEPKMLGEPVYIGEKSPPVDANPLPLR
ncbi:SanA protein [Roseimicrobium gellanilyticum]|uniref:SanA protein n=1 Tax=Roseimicrobium gellanilyticum TaxID=748857 RepID=A0A366H8Q7_9BACT|nr:ElyC/SanA/YdcF family protein [Roseimicrobium gellanilyticum]RBP38494.1 SanA protein [Roseimicrobium gellanilyticum]